MYDAGLILEGGAFRGVFTAGVLDYFMEKNLMLSSVIGVSAGACCAFSYVSNQPYRTKDCMLYRNGSDSFYGLQQFVETHRIINFEKLFFEYPLKQFPFDIEGYQTSPMENEIVVTNCITGKAEYYCERSSFERAALLGEATCAVPFVVEPVMVSGVPYMDGGISDPIPLERSIKKGYTKNVVILTKHAEFKSKLTHNVAALSSLLLKKYPGAAESFALRADTYDRQMKVLESHVESGDTFLIRPEIPTVETFEFNIDKLNAFYEHGYQVAKSKYPQLIEFLEKKESIGERK